MPLIPPAYRGPLVIVGVGVGFAAVGAVPLAATVLLGTRSSATIIGMGFVGFGALLMLPGVCWCVMVRTHSFKALRRSLQRRRGGSDAERQGVDDDDDAAEHTPALQKSSEQLNGPSDALTSRSKCWPPAYCDPPPLIVIDHGVCRAATPTNAAAAAASHDGFSREEPATAADDDEAVTEPLCGRTSAGGASSAAAAAAENSGALTPAFDDSDSSLLVAAAKSSRAPSPADSRYADTVLFSSDTSSQRAVDDVPTQSSGSA